MIEETLARLVPEKDAPNDTLFNAARYALLGGGKRLRPRLAIATVEAFHGDVERALIPAACLEMIHTYSLIHDDLPCMDNDDFRRGKPTLHRAYSEGHAVLTGDFLLTLPFEVLASYDSLSGAVRLELIKTLAKSAGAEGMILGQALDIQWTGKPISEELLHEIHRGKTAAMIACSMEFGAIIAEASDEKRAFIRLIGEKLGLAFQVVDDILDIQGVKKKRVEGISSDLANQKTTFATLLGEKAAKDFSLDLLNQALDEISALVPYPAPLNAIATSLVHRVE